MVERAEGGGEVACGKGAGPNDDDRGIECTSTLAAKKLGFCEESVAAGKKGTGGISADLGGALKGSVTPLSMQEGRRTIGPRVMSSAKVMKRFPLNHDQRWTPYN